MLVKFSTLAGGVFIEVRADAESYGPADRCFRFDEDGRSEWASYADLTSANPAPRWFGHAFRAADFEFA
jgi:hypothetical protein